MIKFFEDNVKKITGTGPPSAAGSAPPVNPGALQQFGHSYSGLGQPIPAGTTLTDKDVSAVQAAPGGSLNQVYPVDYNKPLGSSGATRGYFKPQPFEQGVTQVPSSAADVAIGAPIEKWVNGKDVQIATRDPHLAERAVASSRLDKALGVNVLTDEFLAEHTVGGQTVPGNVSADAGPGMQPMLSRHKVVPSDPDRRRERRVPDSTAAAEPGNYFQHTENGKTENLRLTDAVPRVSDMRPEARGQFQKGLSDLQLMDVLTGQVDRHAGNIFFNKQTGQVKGIDNDQAFGSGPDATVESRQKNNHGGKQIGLPNYVDAATHASFSAMKPDQLAKILGQKDKSDPLHGALEGGEIKAAQQRLAEIQAHLKTVKKRGGVVGPDNPQFPAWNQDVYNAQMQEHQHAMGPSDWKQPLSYLHRAHLLEKDAAHGDGGQVLEESLRPAQPPPLVNLPPPVNLQPPPASLVRPRRGSLTGMDQMEQIFAAAQLPNPAALGLPPNLPAPGVQPPNLPAPGWQQPNPAAPGLPRSLIGNSRAAPTNAPAPPNNAPAPPDDWVDLPEDLARSAGNRGGP